MKDSSLLICAAVVIALFGLVAIFLWRCSDDWCFVFTWQKARAVESFERCAQLGFPVMESYPRQCAANGKTYAEQVVPVAPPSAASIRVDAPMHGETIASPFVVRGEAPGLWFFEASFPVKLLDGNGNVLAATHVDATSDWMTTSLVPFEATLTFSLPTTGTGTLVFAKDNPSDLPQNAASFSIPVRFGKVAPIIQGKGTLEGTMTIGPICPVERIDHPCLPSPEMYAAYQVFVYAQDHTTLIATLIPDALGKFHTTLPSGTYYIDMKHQSVGRISGVPASVALVQGKVVILSIAIDTGIR